jgi:hypothetical protein
MPTRSMLQVRVDQYVAGIVNTVYAVDDWAAMFLDPRQNTVIREISSEEYGGVLANTGSGTTVALEGVHSHFVRVDLHPVRGEDIINLYGPSHVDSPAFDARGGAILRVFGPEYDGGNFSVSRILAAHTYLDQGV